VVTRFVFARGWCPRCKKWVFSRHPEQSSTAIRAAACHVGPRARALAADLKCRLGLPFRKIQELFKDLYKVEITAGALVQSNHRLAQRAKATEDAMKQALGQEPIVGADETGWRVAGESHWLWVVCSERFTIYEIAPDRVAKIVREILGEGFEGFLVRDGWSSYDAQLSYQMVRCLRHLQRNAEDLEDDLGEQPAAETLALFVWWIDGVFDLKKQHRRAEVTGEQYHEQAHEMIGWFEDFIAEQKRDASTSSLPSFAARLETIRPQIVPILEHPEIPATNNHSERQIRPAVVHRKISAGNKTEKGAQTLGRLASLAVSCRQNLVKFADVVQSILLNSAPEHPVLFWEKTDPSPS
jgi:transposase